MNYKEIKWYELPREPRQDVQLLLWDATDEMIYLPVLGYFNGEFRTKLGGHLIVKVTHWAYAEKPEKEEEKNEKP